MFGQRWQTLVSSVCFLQRPLDSPCPGKGKGGRGDKKTAQSSSSKAGLQFPVGRIGRYLRQGKYATRMVR